MATSYPAPVTAMQVGSYFVGQYYQVLKERPELAHQFYTETSSMVRVDGESSESGSTMLQIHSLLMSLNLATIEVKTINSLESWNGGIVVMVSGLVKTKDSIVRRKFVQTFFLAPQDKGFFVLNDIFQFFEDATVPQHSAPMVSESRIDVQLNASSPVMDPPVHNYVLEEEPREYVNSVNIEDNLDDEYNLQEQQHYDEAEAEAALENAYAEDNSISIHTLDAVPVTPDVLDEPAEEPQRKTYASILRAAKAQSAAAAAATAQPSYGRTLPNMSDWEYNPQPAAPAQLPKPTPYVEPVSVVEAADEGYGEDEGLSKSVYVRNLPPTVTNADIEEVFRNFGTIRPDGVAIKIRKEIGVCYAFVEFEDLFGVQNALKASPVMVAGKPVYVEERRANTTGGVRGGRRGRGRGGYQSEGLRGRLGGQSLGRGSNLDNDYSRPRGNGSYFRGSQ
ncbi:nuclear transport factor 2 [Eucalyptus grandis]|uniref:Uncharacterized protein n=4 Tax=Eucalyptus grandis TaxID=71139 RepID=A0ACC3IUU2_EUCGR|nr:nuclear transport factor 2 [Eucalyptus grandis]KAK3405179.1 hypothetical protein EUGRSUZ_K01428 [Eucalyptus grandis]